MGNICVNRLRAKGSKQQIEVLAAIIKKSYETEIFEEDYIESENYYQLELYFDTSWRFPKDHFREITSSLPDNKELNIRVASDEPATNYLEQSIFKEGKWSFDKSNIDLTKKAPLSTLTRYSDDKYAYTSGAYLQRVSYINLSGKRVFGWMVTGFEEDTYRNGDYLEVEADADTLEGLTPPEAELSNTEHIDFE